MCADTITPPLACSKAFEGLPKSIPAARYWVRKVLREIELRGVVCPCADDLLLLVSELATNAVIHSASGEGGRFALQIEVNDASIWVTCIDMGPALTPAPRPEGEGGHGLEVVKRLADAYEVRISPTSRTVCCWLDWAMRRPPDHTATTHESVCDQLKGDPFR